MSECQNWNREYPAADLSAKKRKWLHAIRFVRQLRAAYLTALFTSIALLPVACQKNGLGTEGGNKISDDRIRGEWIKVSDDYQKDTAIFTEERLEAPGASAFGGGYQVRDGKVILADEVMAEYEIENDTLYMERFIAEEPDGLIDYATAVKYIRMTTDNPGGPPDVTDGDMDSIGKNIPIGLPLAYDDTIYTAGMELMTAAWDTFTMGITEYAGDTSSFGFPHKTCLTYNYYIKTKEVTCAE